MKRRRMTQAVVGVQGVEGALAGGGGECVW
jgi:hypothetical protein